MNERATLHFRLCGIPVTIYPISWIFLFFLGGGLRMDSGDQLADTLLFVVAGMLCLLVHEMGHALTGRQLTGSLPVIEIAGLGGLTYTPRPPQTRPGYFLYVFAGPFASLLLGVVGGLLFGLRMGHPLEGICISLAAPLSLDINQELLMHVHEAGFHHLELGFYLQLFWVCMWWSLFNLLPIYPLDGSKLLGTLLGNMRVACMAGLGFSALLLAAFVAWALVGDGSWINACIVGYLAYINYQCLRAERR